MEKTHEWHNCVVAVTAKYKHRVLISGDPELIKFMEGDLFEDNCAWGKLEGWPTEPGVYVGTIEYYFEQGYYDGYMADSESEWDYKFVNWKLLTEGWGDLGYIFP